MYRTANFSVGGLDIDNTLEKRRKQSSARPVLVLAESTVDPRDRQLPSRAASAILEEIQVDCKCGRENEGLEVIVTVLDR